MENVLENRLNALIKVPMTEELCQREHTENHLPIRYLIGCFGRAGVQKKQRLVQYLLKNVFAPTTQVLTLNAEVHGNEFVLNCIFSEEILKPKVIIIEHADRLCINYKKPEILEQAAVRLKIWAEATQTFVICLLDRLCPQNDVYLPADINQDRQRFYAQFKGADIFFHAPEPKERIEIMRKYFGKSLSDEHLKELLVFTDYATHDEIERWCQSYAYLKIEYPGFEFTLENIIARIPRRPDGRNHICNTYNTMQEESAFREACRLDALTSNDAFAAAEAAAKKRQRQEETTN